MYSETSVTDSYNEISHTGLTEELVALGFSNECLSALAPAIAVTRLLHFSPGDIIFHQKTYVDALYLIRDGRIKLLNYRHNGRARIVRLHNRGAILGLNGLMGEVHTHAAVAIDKVLAYQIPISLVMLIKHKDHDTYNHLLECMQQELHLADTWITDFSTGAIRGRVARLLRFLIETDKHTGPREVTLLTVEEMAEILGVTPESVSRIMADLKRRNILQAMDGDSPDCFQCDIERLLIEAEK